MRPLVQRLETIATRLETSLASILNTTASKLSNLAATHDSAPVSTRCAAHLYTLSDKVTAFYADISPTNEVILGASIAFLSSVILIALAVTLSNAYFGPDPILSPFPFPSSTYDPDEDDQCDQFVDADVEPQLVPEDAPEAIQAINPSTGETLGWVQYDDSTSVDASVARARSAQVHWAKTTFEQRRSVLRVLLNYLLYEQRDLCKLSRLDSGKTLLDASLGEMVPTLEKLRWLVAEGEAALTEDNRTTGPLTRHKRATVEYMPLGVIAAIAPWNYPLHNMFNPVISSLFAGNAIVVKPSEHTIYSSLHYARIIRRALSLCGHSPELMQIVIGEGDVGAALVNSDIDKVFFTGSTKIGHIVAQSAAKRLLPAVLELGGKDPFIVCDDADLKHAATICMRGVFQNAGQNCIGIERVFVHQKVMQKFVDIIVARTKSIRLDIDMGAITMGEPALQHIQALVDDAVKQGAELLTGGRRATVSGKGFFYEPTVLKGITPNMRIAREEVFGPVLSLFEWHDDNALIKKVNACPFGLGSSVFSGNKKRADRILSALRVGMGNVNDYATNYLCQSMPFGGTKESGSDKFAGIEGLRGCCIAKAVTRDRIPGVKTTIPRALQYPVGANAFEFSAEISDFMFGNGLLSKFDNIRNMIGMVLFPSWRPRITGSG